MSYQQRQKNGGNVISHPLAIQVVKLREWGGGKQKRMLFICIPTQDVLSTHIPAFVLQQYYTAVSYHSVTIAEGFCLPLRNGVPHRAQTNSPTGDESRQVDVCCLMGCSFSHGELN